MDDRPRQVPREQPGLRTRQAGNFISVRQKPDQDGGWGTLLNPKPLELSLAGPVQVRSRLGYEAVPSSEFWQFSTPGRARLQVNRLSPDRYACHVGVALLDENNRRVAPLVQSASGRGAMVEIKAGRYKVVASLGMAVAIKDLTLEFSIAPADTLKGLAAVTLGAMGHLPTAERRESNFMRGRSDAAAEGIAALLGASSGRHLSAMATVEAASTGRFQPSSANLSAVAVVRADSGGVVRSGQRTAEIEGIAAAGVNGAARVREVRWVNEPDSSWRIRVKGGVVELNRSYVTFTRDEATVQQLLLRLTLDLNR